MRLLAVGRMRPGPEASLFERYSARLRPNLALTEFAEGRDLLGLLAMLPADNIVVALDEGGLAPDSAGFALMLRKWYDTSRSICFVIGGAEGLDHAVIERSDQTLSLGPMTWPHLLVRGMLAEQIYRAQSILAGHPYHRAGRP